ncbi:MAG: amidohydrolase [Planctomycetota bacterium]
MIAIALIAWLGLVSIESGPTETADLILKNGNFYALSGSTKLIAALAAKHGKIIFVGDLEGAMALAEPETQVVDLLGATVVPGLIDAHMHLDGVGFEAMQLNLKGVASLSELLKLVAREAAQAAPGAWITGRGWIETHWTPARFPTRGDLDAVSADHPVWLRRVDGHGAVANSKALALAGITRDAPANPLGGEIVRAENGEPTGMLLDNAQELVERLLPAPTAEQKREAFRRGAELYAKRGWTGVHVAGTTLADSRLLATLVEEGQIPIRIYSAVYGPGEDADALLAEGPVGIAAFARFTRRAVKVSFDGALGSMGAAMLEPYCHVDSTGHGFLKYEDAPLAKMFDAALKAGIQIEVHAIGDRANRHILDLYQAAFERVAPPLRKVPEPRWRVEHAQILAPVDIPRFAQLGVIPSMQPSHAISDLHFAASRIGVDRLVGAYAWRSLIDSGAQIAGGSDAPVEAGDPRIEYYAAVARRDQQGFQGPEWHPEQSVSRLEGLLMLTKWAARAAFQEDWLGSLEVGKACDLSVFNRDLLKIAPAEILTSECLLTVVGGRIVHRAGL